MLLGPNFYQNTSATPRSPGSPGDNANPFGRQFPGATAPQMMAMGQMGPSPLNEQGLGRLREMFATSGMPGAPGQGMPGMGGGGGGPTGGWPFTPYAGNLPNGNPYQGQGRALGLWQRLAQLRQGAQPTATPAGPTPGEARQPFQGALPNGSPFPGQGRALGLANAPMGPTPAQTAGPFGGNLPQGDPFPGQGQALGLARGMPMFGAPQPTAPQRPIMPAGAAVPQGRRS